jgi:hypothetical protein
MRIYCAAVLPGGHDHILNHPHAVQYPRERLPVLYMSPPLNR